VSAQRSVVRDLQGAGLGERAACRVVGIDRTSYRYQGTSTTDDATVRERIQVLAHHHRRYGYRRITALLRREGTRINHKRVWAIWRAEGLQVPRQRVRKRHRGSGTGLPTAARHRGHVWTYDFVFDRAERGQTLKMLTVLDEYTRECHQIRVGLSLTYHQVIETLGELVAAHGAPGYIRSDNGGEFIAEHLRSWLAEAGLATIHITPGHPWENGYIESFNGKLRDECLNEEIFWNVQHAQVVIEHWRRHYNEERPHSSLGYLTPSEFASTTHTQGTILLGKKMGSALD